MVCSSRRRRGPRKGASPTFWELELLLTTALFILPTLPLIYFLLSSFLSRLLVSLSDRCFFFCTLYFIAVLFSSFFIPFLSSFFVAILPSVCFGSFIISFSSRTTTHLLYLTNSLSLSHLFSLFHPAIPPCSIFFHVTTYAHSSMRWPKATF